MSSPYYHESNGKAECYVRIVKNLRARRSVFWPNMNVDIAKIVNQCELCQVHGGPQTKTYTYNMNESSHYPMHCVGTDLFEYKQKTYLLMIDYFSSYPWV